MAEAREKRGISQRELSRRLDMHPMTVMRLEHGKRDLTLGEFIAIAVELGEDPAEMLRKALSR